ncbi:recombinase family protein [Kribbella sp. ALI-6-A]|uniref:recombinase family protein n=1 Tax=Kribbella sp. ALI-6-A TaxID=1933817 RepID=UPI00192D1978|nr:recombinase family protein [Kribbella sp. ALI-6-A]
MALVGLVRVSTRSQETARQHDALDPICVKVFEEKLSGTLRTEDRPELTEALDYLREGDMLTVQEVDRLGRNLLEGLIVLNDLFQRGVAVKVLEGIAAGEHVERSLILDLALALAEDRRRDLARKTKNGLDAARARGRVGGRPTVVDADKRRAILARRAERESLRTISKGVGVSLAVVHRVVTEHEAQLVLSAAEPAEQQVSSAPLSMPAPPTTSSCPGCGHRPNGQRDQRLLRDALGTVWLLADPDRPGEVREHWYCDHCQPHGADLVMCPCGGDSVMTSAELAGHADISTSAVTRWLTSHGWIHHEGTWYCARHFSPADQ